MVRHHSSSFQTNVGRRRGGSRVRVRLRRRGLSRVPTTRESPRRRTRTREPSRRRGWAPPRRFHVHLNGLFRNIAHFDNTNNSIEAIDTTPTTQNKTRWTGSGIYVLSGPWHFYSSNIISPPPRHVGRRRGGPQHHVVGCRFRVRLRRGFSPHDPRALRQALRFALFSPLAASLRLPHWLLDSSPMGFVRSRSRPPQLASGQYPFRVGHALVRRGPLRDGRTIFDGGLCVGLLSISRGGLRLSHGTRRGGVL